jgi:hypothetical protein
MTEERTMGIRRNGIVVIAAFLIGFAVGVLVTWTVGLADGAQI